MLRDILNLEIIMLRIYLIFEIKFASDKITHPNPLRVI